MNTTAPRTSALAAATALALAVFVSCAQTPDEQIPNAQSPTEALQEKRPDIAEVFVGMDLAQELPEPLSEHPELTVETLQTGEGETIRYGMIGLFHLIGTLANGSQFQSTYDGDAPEPRLMRLLAGSMPKGLALGLDGCQVGERRLIAMPSELAYGDQPDFSQGAYIPAHASLTYEIELVEIERDLAMKILQEGTGEAIEPGQQGQFHYTGVLAEDGTVFDASTPDQPVTFALRPGGTIEGWILGLPGMKVGEKRRLRIPSELAYGETGGGENSPIGPDADLVFDVELAGVVAIPGQR